MNKVHSYSPLTDVLEKIIDNRGKTVPTVRNGIPLIATNCIKHKSIYPTFENVRYVSQGIYDTWFRAHLEPHDILFVNKGTPGRSCLVPDPVSFCAAQDMIGLRCDKNKISYKYLFAVLRSDYIKQTVENFHVGLVIPHFKKHDLHNILIPRRDNYTEEDRIGSLYISLSEKIEHNNKVNKQLEAMARMIYDYWFVQFDFPDENNKPYKSSGEKMAYNAALKREIPIGWENGTVNDLAEIVGGSTPSTKVSSNFTDLGTPWITPNDLSDNIGNKYITRGKKDVSNEGIRDASLKIYPEGTVLLSSRAPIGYMAIAREPVTTNQGFKSFVPSKGYPTEYLYYAVKNLLDVIIQYSSGSTFKEISGGVLRSVDVCLPPKELVAKYVDEVLPLFKQQDILEQQSQQLTELRDWLLPMLMNGQVMVNTKVAAIQL